MTVLINAYACSPNMGSEPGMGWNWICSIARHCEVHVITESEFRNDIEQAVECLTFKNNLHFHYNPVSEHVRQMCWNQGDWRFYWYYWLWQRKTAEITRRICKTQKIDILHQLNMVGFREPGCLLKISKEFNIPLVWGPIGGIKLFPMAYASGIRMKSFQGLKNTLNILQLILYPRVRRMMKHADVLISAIPDSQQAIKKYYGRNSILIPETGCHIINDNDAANISHRFFNKEFNVIWVGKFDFRKRLDIAIHSIAQTGNSNIRLQIYGNGNEQQTAEAKALIKQLKIEDQVHLMGSVPTKDIHVAMRHADLFLFTSVSEDTSTVVLEAISNHLPVLCFNSCGMAAVIDDSVGWKVDLSTPKQSVKDFANRLNYLYNNRNELLNRSRNCAEKAASLSWNSKGEQLMAIYKDIISS